MLALGQVESGRELILPTFMVHDYDLGKRNKRLENSNIIYRIFGPSTCTSKDGNL